MTLLAEALTWYQRGYMPLPIRPDGSKAPAVTTWTPYRDTRPPIGTVIDLFNVDHDGLGLICGAPSGGLEMLELEGRAVREGLLPQLAQAFADHGMTELWQRIDAGYSEITPSGGIHWYYRVEGAPVRGNTKLAQRPSNAAELAANPKQSKQALVETRGQGGFTVIAPSAGRTHPDGVYTVRTGSPDTIPVIPGDDADAIHIIAGTLDQMPPAAEPAHASGRERQPGDPLRPGDDFNERATWDEILTPHGWTLHGRIGQSAKWRKPGKTKPGISATTGTAADADRLYVFSTSTEFEPERPYTKFAAYVLLNHNGDYSAAAKALAADGYGDQVEISPADPLAGLIAPAVQSAPRADGATALAPEPRQLEAVDRIAERYGPTEDGTARALAHLHNDRLRYCAQRDRWLHWNGARWEWDDTRRHREYVKTLARTLPETADWKGYKKRALSATGTTGIVKQAESDPIFAVHIDTLDANPYELNTPAGVIDLRTGQLRPPDPRAMHTRTTACAPDFTRPGERWLKFLADTFGGDQALITYVQRLLGVSLIGTVLEQALVFAHGLGANGKSTLIEIAMDVSGRGETGYAIAAPSEMLMIRRHSEHPAELAQLAGARLVVCSELEDGARFAEARMKQLTGRDSINARFMRGNPFTFTPTHSLWLIGNHKPEVATGGLGFWRRLRAVPFDHVVPEHERDQKLPEKLTEEAPAILAWIVRGAADYITHGLQAPDAVNAATAAYAADQDSVGKFVQECCHTGASGLQTPTGRLRDAYEGWCRESGDSPVSAKRFTQELKERFGVQSGRASGGRSRIYQGIGLINDDEDQSWFR